MKDAPSVSAAVSSVEDRKTILKIEKLWVDMPGETVRNVNLEVKEGEILGIGGLAGQGKLGIPNGIMGLYEAGGRVEFDGNEIPLNSPRKCLDSSFAFVSEDRRGVGLLLDESLEQELQQTENLSAARHQSEREQRCAPMSATAGSMLQ